MSKAVDERVVEMQFDNRNFEKNVSSTMSALDKLKQKLNFSGASKGLEQVDAAAKRVDMSTLGRGVETVRAKFSAMDVVAVTALANITNQAVNAGKRIISALTIDPIKTGFKEYETQINAVQTILANTQSKGTTLTDVNAALDQLNTYADKTIYNFTEMTRNIGTFTAAGVDLDTSVNAIQGIANLAAISGSTSQQASTAMYQLSQALAAGTVKLMDWNSVVNAGMGGQVFQDALKETARAHGIAIDSMIKEQGSFRETLSEGWITSEILTETLQKFTLTTEGLTDAQIKANREMLRAKGYTEAQIDEIFKLGENATNAATKVKTFTQLWDTLKESAQSGWTQTWELIVGDFEEAKTFLTMLSDTFGDIIGRMSSSRNNMLEKALGSNSKWDDLLKRINKVGISTDDFNAKLKETAKESGYAVDDLIAKHGSLAKAFSAGAIKSDIISKTLKKFTGLTGEASKSTSDMTDKLEYYQKVVDEVWGGKWGHRGEFDENGVDRVKALTEAGYDYATVQALVNRTVDGHRLTMEDLVAVQADMSDAQLKNVGYTEEQIRAIRKLASEAEKTGTPLNELIKDLQKPSGRELLIESITNAISGLKSVLSSIGNAWEQVFPTDQRAQSLYNILEGINAFSKHLVVGEDTAKELTRTLKGLFAIIDIIATLTGGAFRIVFKVVDALLKHFDTNILSVTASLGDGAVKLRDWIDSLLNFEGIFAWLIPKVEKCAKAIAKWFRSLKDTKAFKDLAKHMSTAIDRLREFIKELKSSDNIPRDIIRGLIDGLKNGVTLLWNAAKELGKSIIDSIKNILGIHSPSTVMIAIGGFIIAGLIRGIKNGVIPATDAVKGLIDKIVGLFEGMDIGDIVAGGMSLGITSFIFSLSKATGGLGKVFDSTDSILGRVDKILKKSTRRIDQILKNVSKVVKSFSKVMDSISFAIKVKAIKDLAITIGILVVALIALALMASKYSAQMWEAVGMITVLSAILIGLTFAMDKLSSASMKIDKNGIDVDGVKNSLIGMATSLLLVAIAVKLLSDLDRSAIKRGLGAITAIVGIFAFLTLLSKLDFGKGFVNNGADKLGASILKMAASIGLLVIVMKMIAKMDDADLKKGYKAIVTLGIVIAALVLVQKGAIDPNVGSLGTSMLKLAVAMGILALVVKLLGTMNWDQLKVAAAGIGTLGGVMVALVGVMKFVSLKQTAELSTLFSALGSIFLKVGLAIGILALSMKLLATMDWSEMGIAATGLTLIAVIVAGLILIVRKTGATAGTEKIGTTLLGLAGAIAVLVLVVMAITLLDFKPLLKGLLVVGILGAFVALLIWSTKGTANSKDGILAMAALIAIVVAIAAALMLIKDTRKLLESVGILTILLLSMALLFKSMSSLGGTDVKKTAALYQIIGAITTLIASVAALVVLDKYQVDVAIETIGALTILMAAIAGIVWSMGHMKANPKEAWRAARSMLISLIPLTAIAAFVWGLHALNVKGSIETVSAISILMLALGGVLLTLSKIDLGKFDAKKTAQAIVGLTAMVVPMLAFMYAMTLMGGIKVNVDVILALVGVMSAMTLLLIPLSHVGKVGFKALIGVLALTAMAIPMLALLGIFALFPDVKIATDTALSLVALMAAMTLVLAPLALIGKLAGVGSLIGVLALTAMAVPMLAFLSIFALFPDVRIATDTAMALVTLMTAMTLLLMPLTVIGMAGPIALIGVLALTAMAVPMLAFLGVLSLMEAAGLQNANTNAQLLITLIATMTDLLVELAPVAPLAVVGVAALTALSILMTALGVMAVGVGALMTNFPKLQEFLDTGIPVLVQLANGCGQIVSAFAEGLTSGLPDIGNNLSDFMTNAEGFVTGVERISANAAFADGVKSLVAAILGLTAAELVSGLSSFLPFSGGLAQLGTDLSLFMKNALPFILIASALDPTMMDGVKALADTVLVLTAADVINGIASWLGGGSSLSSFGEQLGGLGTSMRAFIDNLGTFDEGSLQSVNIACEAIKKLADAADSLPNEGGWIAAIVGENSLGAFSDKLPGLGSNLASFINNLGTFEDGQLDTVNIACDAIKALASAAQKIPNEGGFWAKIVGENSIATFGGYLPDLGSNLASFINNLGTFEAGQLDTVKVACDAIKALAGAASVIPKEGGFWASIVGENSLASFGDQLSSLGSNLSAFVTNLGTFDEGQRKTVTSAIGAIKAFATLADSDIKGAKKNLEGFGDKLSLLATDIASFASNLPSSESIDAAIANLNKVVNAITQLKDVPDISAFTDDLKDLGTKSVSKFVSEFTSDSAKTNVKQAGAKLVSSVINGVESKETALSNSFADTAAAAPVRIEDKYQGFYDAGVHLVSGFVAGIDDNTFKAEAAASAMAAAAEKAAKEQLEQNSPSKVFKRIGEGVPEGFVLGIGSMTSAIRDSSMSMTDAAVDTVKRSIAKMSRVINGEVQTQPTIRPVVDLSGVRTGAAAIESMFGTSPSMGTIRSVSVIDHKMSDRRQNGFGSEVVSAIGKLRRDISGISKPSYIINGVTYDDGSNVARAINEIARYAVIEGRV